MQHKNSHYLDVEGAQHENQEKEEGARNHYNKM